MAKTKKQLLAIAERNDWHIYDCKDGDIEFSKYSDYGQDFSFCIGSDDLIGNLDSYIESFDVSEETAKWLDDTGHGTNGAPYDMADVYKDMENCKEMMQELLAEWQK